MLTEEILMRTSLLQKLPEATPENYHFSMFNDGGVEIEVAEFLFSLVRMIKPSYIVETGTHLGISALYMALALNTNYNEGCERGGLTTFEIIPELRERAKRLWGDIGIQDYIDSRLEKSLEGSVDKEIDLLFLDSEPQLRFDEFLRFWSLVKPGAFILIHDLHPSMGHHGQTYHGVYDWPYGDFREKLGPFFKSDEVQTIHFRTPRGFTLFQKVDPDFERVKFLKE